MATPAPPPWCTAAGEMRVLLAPESLQSSSSAGQFISLRHPKSGTKTSYFLSAAPSQSLHELHWFKEPYASWFLGDYVLEDGGMYILTPVDLVFLLLPVLDEARMKKKGTIVGDADPGKFRQLDEILFVEGFPGYQQLLPLAEKMVSIVCQVKELGEECRFFRLDDDKVLDWLVFKAKQLKATLPNLDRHYANRDEKDTLADAVLIMGEYLDSSWMKLLFEHLKLSYDELTAAAAPVVKDNNVAVIGGIGNGEGVSNAFQAKSEGEKKSAKPGRGAKKAKVETGSQNIGDMFRRVTRRG